MAPSLTNTPPSRLKDENQTPTIHPMDPIAYDDYISSMRRTEYGSMVEAGTYLDHAGSTPASRTALTRFTHTLTSQMYGNPHAGSGSSMASTFALDEARCALLRFVDADPLDFDVVFTPNATAAIKLVADALRDSPEGFWYGFHREAHTSLVGVRELAIESRCFLDDADVEAWLDGRRDEQDDEDVTSSNGLFAYPAQSNLNGRRFPYEWAARARRRKSNARMYTLLDAASFAPTARIDLSDDAAAPDFIVLSLHKIFGFPDLGALVVRKAAASAFDHVRYFGGGTVDMVVCVGEQWHAKKSSSLHQRLEQGTPPFHSAIALKAALDTHAELFGTLDRVAAHTSRLAEELYQNLSSLRHANDRPVCTIHKHPESCYGDAATQGPIVAFNLLDNRGQWMSNTEVEKFASIRRIHLRTGGVCNPGGVATALHLAPWEMRANFSAGARCGDGNDIVNGKPTGVIRLSLGPMSTREDVSRFVEFVDEFFVDKTLPSSNDSQVTTEVDKDTPELVIESLTVYPIKSCGGFRIPADRSWEIRPEGLAWDREWCIVNLATGEALSQKRHPHMALVRPNLDFDAGVLRIRIAGRIDQITVPLSKNPKLYKSTDMRDSRIQVCGDAVNMDSYSSPAVADFFTKFLGLPCTLARFTASAGRHSKVHLRGARVSGEAIHDRLPIQLSNESPILVMSRASLDSVNDRILAKGGKPAQASLFRANIVLDDARRGRDTSDDVKDDRRQSTLPWDEDHWRRLRLCAGAGGPTLELLGGCRRCQMVCIDQDTAERNPEPFVTLAKMRRIDGVVLFGVHAVLDKGSTGKSVSVSIRAGKAVYACR